MDWNSPLIYDTYIYDGDLMEVSSLSSSQENDKNWDACHVFDKIPYKIACNSIVLVTIPHRCLMKIHMK